MDASDIRKKNAVSSLPPGLVGDNYGEDKPKFSSYAPAPDTKYNQRMKDEQQQKQVEERVKAINDLRNDYKFNRAKYENYVGLMNFIENLLHVCGGEAKANFVEVARDFMKLATRVPMKANLHPFMPEDAKDNPRFHKVVTQILLEIPQIEGIRWIPTAEGTFLILSVKRD